MEFPFTQGQFFEVFGHYIAGLWIVPFLIWIVGGIFAATFYWPTPIRNAWIVWFLDLLWLINASGYHLGAFWRINPAAPAFAAIFFLEAVLLGSVAITSRGDLFPMRSRATIAFSATCVGFSLILYPFWHIAEGRDYPAMPLFGVAPCPTTIFTIGILVLMRSPQREWLMILPLIWCVIGGSAALLLGVTQDYALWLAGIGAFVLLIRDRLRAET